MPPKTNDGTEGLSIQDLAVRMLGQANNPAPQTVTDAAEEVQPEQTEVEQPEQDENVHWQTILNAVPEEYHEALRPQLEKWDKGVSRRFEKIHKEYDPYKELVEKYDSDYVGEALKIMGALQENPAATWEAIGRVYGLSPQQVSQAASTSSNDDDEDFDIDDLPGPIKAALEKVGLHEQVLEGLVREATNRNQAQEEAEEDAALEEYLAELREEHGDFDEDYVIALLANGMDGDDAVGQYQALVARINPTKAPTPKAQPQQPQPVAQPSRPVAPKVMNSGGGIPAVPGPDVSKMSRGDTKSLIIQLLEASRAEQS